MKKKKLIRLTTLIMMGFFLFTATYSYSHYSSSLPKTSDVFEVSKKSSCSLLDLSFLFAESNEKDEETATAPQLLSLTAAVFYFNSSRSTPFAFYLAPRSFGNSSRLPVYLAKRSLLI